MASESRQLRWKRAQVAAGRCSQCGREPLHPDSRRLGALCLAKARAGRPRKTNNPKLGRPGIPLANG
jgi:hypothetical protein